jgi:hypothetical protein
MEFARFIGMISERPYSSTCRAHAGLYARLAKQTASAEAKATLLYLEQLWIVIAKMARAVEENGLRAPVGSAHHLLPPD